jgi:predicted dehydrogenase
MQLGVHGIDLVQDLFGPVTDLSAHTATLKPERMLKDGRAITTSLDDNVLAQYQLASGALVTHEMSYTEVAGCDRFRLEVNCEHGTVWLRTERGLASIYAPAVTGVEGWVTPDIVQEPLGRAHHAAWLEIATGRAAPDRTGIAGLSSILVSEAIYRAAKTGKREPVQNALDVLEGGV